ncbi:MAG: hypothetical protein ACUZ8I_07335 [Candidatus Scalindua sp.]
MTIDIRELGSLLPCCENTDIVHIEIRSDLANVLYCKYCHATVFKEYHQRDSMNLPAMWNLMISDRKRPKRIRSLTFLQRVRALFVGFR